jgi:hypothetical protein
LYVVNTMSSEKISKSRNIMGDSSTSLPGKRPLADVFAKAGLTGPGHAHPVAVKIGRTDSEQQYWRQLTQDYEKIRKMLPPRNASKAEAGQNGPSRKFPRHPSSDLIWDDLETLYRTALPGFQYLLLARTATIELACLWGRLCFTAAAFDLAKRQPGSVNLQPSLDKIMRRGPLKWYLHWRQFYAQRGLTVHRANSDFLRIAFEVATGIRSAPPGFHAAWFLGALCQGQNKAPRRSLPHAFKRAQKLDLTPLLLSSKPDEDPKIPPVGLPAYQIPEKGHRSPYPLR